jgi:hypothetical protein
MIVVYVIGWIVVTGSLIGAARLLLWEDETELAGVLGILGVGLAALLLFAHLS